LARFLGQFESPLIYILLFALVFDMGTWAYEGATGWPIESLVIGLVLLLNSGLGVVQEYRSEQALARLGTLTAPQTWVMRDGVLVHLPSAEIVPGDVIRIEAGERVSADGVILEDFGFMVDESVLTGESVPVDKTRGDQALSGTLAVRGKGLIEVTRTGPASSMGRLAAMVGGVQESKTPLERRLDAFGHRVARWVLGLAATMIVAGLLAEGLGQLDEILLFAVALAVSAVPEGMPAVVTLTLALGVQKMAGRKAVVRRLQAVEALGSVTVIATDKTGTLTENRMSVHLIEAVDEPEALLAMVLANDADEQSGDPLERGLLDHARSRGLDPAALRATHRRVSMRPFDSVWKFMRVTVERDGRELSYLKGAVEVILERAALTSEERNFWLKRTEAKATEGYRVLGLASAEGGEERALRFLGLVALWDPPRPEVADAVRIAQDAGVRIVMITGDHPATAQAVARTIGIVGAERPVSTGTDLERLSSEQLREIVQRVSVFARVSPEHKLAIVDALKAAGEIVAVTGDGVNDAPALKRSDVGVAMGQRGSDVAREVADLVLLDDNFASIVAAIEEGRSIYTNIRKFIRFLFSTNVAEVLLVVAGTIGAYILGLREADGSLLLPLTAVQILWVNFITDGPPALALGVDRNSGMMQEKPRAPTSKLLDPQSLSFILVSGILKATVAGVLLITLPIAAVSLEATRTSVFLYTTLAQLAFAYPARRIGAPPLPNLALNLAIVLGAALQVATVLVPQLREALGLVALDPLPLAATAVAVGVTWAGAEMVNYLLRSPRTSRLFLRS
jgi:Ca2+-transporting ATPase